MLGNKNRKIKLIIFLLVCVNVFSVNVWAQNTNTTVDVCKDSNICGSPSEEYKAMTDFIKEILGSVKTIGTKGDYLGKYVSPNRFKGGVFDPPNQGLVDKWLENISQNLQSVMAVVNIVSSLKNFGGLKDVTMGFVVLFKNKVFFRDYKTLMQIDSLINNKKFELGQAGGWYDTIREENRKQIQTILDKYGPSGKGIFSSARILPNANYGQIMNVTAKINSSLKTFIAANSTGQFKAIANDVYMENADFKIVFDVKAIQNMQTQYECARGATKCDTFITKFNENIAKIGVSFGSGTTSSRKTITDAVKRLTNAEERSKSQEKLLKNVYGLDTQQIESGGWFGLKNYRSMIISAKSKMNDFGKNVIADLTGDNGFEGMFTGNGTTYAQRRATMSGVRAEIKQLTKIKQSNKSGNLINDELVFVNIIEAMENKTYDISQYEAYRPSVDKILKDGTDQNLNAMISNNTDVTLSFMQTFAWINASINEIIGNRNQDGTLIKNLGDACTEQCKNAGGDCFN